VTGGGGPPPLGAAVLIALRALSDVASVAAAVADGRLEALLRASLAQHCATDGSGRAGGTPDPATAVLTACAHLAAGGREDAYLALRTARDFLPRGSVDGSASGAAAEGALEWLRQPGWPAIPGGGTRRP
jgi:hypothetical protein